MNVKKMVCKCGKKLYRVRIQTSDKNIPNGFSCLECGSRYDENMDLLIPENSQEKSQVNIPLTKDPDALRIVEIGSASIEDLMFFERLEEDLKKLKKLISDSEAHRGEIDEIIYRLKIGV